MKNTTTLRSVVETPDANGPQGGVRNLIDKHLSEGLPAIPKARKRKLAPATAPFSEDILAAQERNAVLPVNDDFSCRDEDGQFRIQFMDTPRYGRVFVLHKDVMSLDGVVERKMLYLTEDMKYRFKVIDDSKARRYKAVQWDPELRRQASAYPPDMWMASLDHYHMLDTGLWTMELNRFDDEETTTVKKGGGGGGGGGDKPPTWHRVHSKPLMVTGLVVDEYDSHYYEFEYYKTTARGSRWQKVLIASEQINNKSGAAFGELARIGIMIDDAKKQAIIKRMVNDFQAVVDADPKQYQHDGRATPGWHNIEMAEGGHSLIYLAAGFSTNETVRLTGSTSTSSWVKAGDEKAYMRRMARTFRQNPVAALICGFNAAGLLRKHLPALDHNPIWVLLGDSSIGKTLVAHLALSMRGFCETLLGNFDATEGALKARMRGFNDVGGAIDEIGSQHDMRPDEKQAAIYQWASGLPKQRLKANALTGEYEEREKDKKAHHYTLLMTGEKTFISLTESSTGNKVRLTQNLFNKANPIWHSIASNKDAEELRTFIKLNYGWLYPVMVELVLNGIDHYQAVYDEFSQKLSHLVDTQQEARKSNSWAMAMTGVQLLSDALATVTDEEDQVVPGFTSDDVDEVFEHACRLMSLELVQSPIVSEHDVFMNFLDSLPANQQEFLYYYDGSMLMSTPDKPKGVFVFKKAHGEGQQHIRELSLMTDHFTTMCNQKKIDSTRFLAWAEEEKILLTFPEKRTVKGVETTVQRNSTKVSINKARAQCHKFVWTTQITDELNFG